MSDDFDIDKFLNESFANVEKKISGKSKKTEKLINKFNKVENATTSIQAENKVVLTQSKMNEKMNIIPNFNISNYNFDNVINTKVFDELNLPNLTKKGENIKLENILKPMFPNDNVYEKEFKNCDKNFILDKFIGNSRRTEKDENMPVTTQQSTNLKINKFKKIKESELIKELKNDKSLSYNELISMNSLWNDYINNLLNKTLQADTINSKMLKADLHGAIIEVIESKNSNQKGIKGLNLLETRRTFNILSEDNKIRTIIKKGTNFSVKLPYTDKSYSVKIIGDNFMFKAVERTKAKFKNKYNL